MDPLLWGEALGSKLAAYIEDLRKSDSALSLAEMAAARGGGRTDDPLRNSPLGGMAATGKFLNCFDVNVGGGVAGVGV